MDSEYDTALVDCLGTMTVGVFVGNGEIGRPGRWPVPRVRLC